MKFYNKFIENETNCDLLETLINDNGLEHLIKVIYLKDYIMNQI